MMKSFFETVEDYADAIGSTPANVVRRVTGNAHSWDRMKRKAETLEEDADRIRAYMTANPVSADTQDSANRHNHQVDAQTTQAAE